MAAGLTSRAGGKKGDWRQPTPTGKGPSPSFPWRPSQPTTEMGWHPDLGEASRHGRGSDSRFDFAEEPDPAWYRRTQPPFSNDERPEFQEVPPPDHECERPQPDGPPKVHLREAWGPPPSMPAGLSTNQTTRFQTDQGTWLFMPFGSDPPGGERQPPGGNQKNVRRKRRRNRNGPPSNDPSSNGTEEQAESEVPTVDPSVDPDELDEAPPLGRQQPQRGAHPVRLGGRRDAGAFGGGGGPGGSPAGSKGEHKSSAASWTSAMGPQKGVKFRGGAPPQPPVWKYQPGDVRAFERYERKVELWRMQIRFYMTRAEAGLMLYSSLTGEAEQQLEYADMSKIFHEDGVQFVVDQLKNAFQQKSVYVKRHVLHEYEHIYRYNMETLRGFINRYRRIEASLMSIGIDVSLTYDSEARGSRLLDRAKLTLEQQRMVLVGTGQRMDFDTVASALCMQFPEYRPAPPIAGKGDNNGKGGKGDGRGHSSSGQSSHHQHRRHDGKGNHFQKPQRVFETVVEETNGDDGEAAPDDGAEIPEGEENDDEAAHDGEQEDHEADEGEGDDFSDLARVLTVTAKKLAAMTQGRKFRNGPKKSIEQRKQESPCAACGELGHWAGDEQCKVSGGKGKASSSKGKTQSKGGKSETGGKKVFTVNHYTGFQTEEPWDEQEFPHSVMVVFSTTSQIPLVSNMDRSAQFMILDTACQRSCCGKLWYQHHERLLKQIEFDKGISLPTFLHHQRELFQFGAGDPQVSSELAHFPMGVQDQCCYLGASILEAGIPFLGSLSMMSKLGFILDIPNNRVAISALSCEVQLVNLDGNMAIDIMQFPKAPELKVAESLLVDKEVNFLMSDDQSVQEPLHDLPDAAARSTSHTTAATSFKTSVKSNFRSHGHRKSSHRVMAFNGGPTPPSPEEDPDSVGLGMEVGNGARCSLRDREFINNSENSNKSSSGYLLDNNCGTKGQFSTGDAISRSKSVHSPELSEVRQRLGQVHQMQGLSPKVEMERRSKRMEIGWILLQTFAAATCALDSNGWSLGAAVNQLSSGGSDSRSELCLPAHAGPYANPEPTSSSTYAQDSLKASLDDIFGCRTWSSDSRSPCGVRHSDGPARGSTSKSLRDLPAGRRKRLTGNITKNVKVLEQEVALVNAATVPTKYNKVDLMELYSGASLPTTLAPSFGLTSLQSFDKLDGYDLNDPQVRLTCEQAQLRFQPLLLIIGLPCTTWCIFNENLNYSHRMPLLRDLREGERDGVRWSVERCITQREMGNFYFFENPLRSRLWEEPEVQALENHPDNYVVLCDAGAFDGRDVDGNLIIKTFKFLTNNKELAEVLGLRLNRDERALCRPLEGQRVTDSQVYPEKMVKTLLRALRAEARLRDPLRFSRPHCVMYAKPLADEEGWRKALEDVSQMFGTTSTKSINLRKDQPLYDQVVALVPWEITRIQVAMTPTMRRMPRDIPFTHRCSALLYVDNTIEVDDEDVANIEFPKQRFARPVRTGIFVFGMAEEDDADKTMQAEVSPDVHIPGLRTDVRFPGLPPNIPREVQASIARLHVNSGHANKKELIRLFTMHGAINSQVLSCLEHLECGTCKRSRLPQAPRPAAVPAMSGQFGDRLQIDRFWVRDLTGTNHCLLGLVDMATSFQQAVRLDDYGSEAVYESMRMTWLQPFGHPLVIESDDDRCFGGAFKEQVESAATHLLVVPAEAHWRIGTVERKNAVLRNTMEKLIDEYAVTNAGGIDLILTAALQAINSSVTSKGRSPYQAVFGRLPRFPGDLFGDERALLVGADHVLAEELRAQALRVIAETRASSVIRRALLRKTANSRQEAVDILPGSLAAYWRWSKKAKGKKRGGYILGRLLSHDPDGKGAWLHNGNSVVQVTYEQLRPAFGIENWTPSSQDVQILKDGATRLQQDLWQDERGPAPPPEEPLDAEVSIEDTEFLQQLPDLAMPLVESSLAPATPAPQPLQLPSLPPRQELQQPTVYSPTFNQTNTQNIHQHFQQQPFDPDTHIPMTPTRSPRSRSPPPLRNSQPASLPARPSLSQPLQPPLPMEDVTETQQLQILNDTPPLLPQPGEVINLDPEPRDPYMTLMTYVDNNQLQEVCLPEEGWDGSQPMPLPQRCTTFRTLASQILDEPVSSDSSDDEKRDGPSDLASMTRQERKAMDREIPWRVIMQEDEKVVNAYIEANKKEYQSWLSWGSIIALSDAEAKQVRQDPVLRHRVIPARNAYRDKNRGVPPLKPKCRTVVLGCLDPDLKLLDRTAPTPHRMTEAVLLQVATSGINGLVQLCPLTWTLWAGDVSTAFLQGDPEPRQGRLFMRPPRDKIQAMSESFPNDLYEVVGNLYGFCNAPRTWNLHVVNQLTKEANLKQHRLDQMLFYEKDKEGKLLVLAIVHVDDFLVTYRKDYKIEKITKLFKWGSQTMLDEKTPITFRGKKIELHKENEQYKIKVTQTDFIDEMSAGKLSRGRLQGEAVLSTAEWKDYRSCAGSLQWLSGQTRPDVGATVSLSNRGSETGPAELKMLYECIDMTKATKDLGLTYQPIPFDKATFIVGYADSSWANAPGFKSQMGCLVLLTTSDCLVATTPASILDWRSGRSPRVTRSTLASEANAMDDCVDRCTYCNHFLTELLYDGAPREAGRKLRQLQVTDCRSLYDAVISPNPVLTEKRTVIQIRSIQEFVSPEDLRWTPTGVMWADGLTKVDVSLLAEFQEWLRNPHVTLVGQ